jgi:hypothetical protein
MSKCALLYFVVGVTLTTASYAFFFQMPSQMMQMGSQVLTPNQGVVPAAKPCECRCITE